MISAKEAKELTDKYVSTDDCDILEDIEKCIRNEIKKGSIRYYARLSHTVKTTLENLGYTLVEGIDDGDIHVDIIWNE